MLVSDKCYFCNKELKKTLSGKIHRQSNLYIRPDEVRKIIDIEFKGQLSEMNKLELGVFSHKKCYFNIKDKAMKK